MKYVIYLRLSKEEADGYGLKTQQKVCIEYINRNGGGEHEIFIDDGYSGALGLADRPGLIDAINTLKRGDVLLVSRRDRIGREVMHNAIIEREIKKKKATLVSVAQDDSTMDEGTSKLMRTILDSLAEYERYLIGARTKAALKTKKSQGMRTGTIPYGFKLSETRKGFLEPDPVEQKNLESIYLLKQNLHWRALEKAVFAQGIRNRKGNKFSYKDLWKLMNSYRPDCISSDRIPTFEGSPQSLQCV